MSDEHCMQISLIICTRNRPRQLARCLEAVERMAKPPGFELVIVDNGSTDETASLIQNYASKCSYAVRYAFESAPGLGRARNRGLSVARGQIIAFTDDDCYVDQGFATAVLQTFQADENIGFMGGRILLHDPEDLPITIMESTEPVPYPPRHFIPAGRIQGANVAFRRTALEQAGGFHPLLGAGTPYPAEDIEMVGRLSAMGWAGLYTPVPTVRHHHGRRTQAEAAKLRAGYEVGRGAYFVAMLKQPTLRASTLKIWYWGIRGQSVQRTVREMRGAVGYFIRGLWGRDTRPPQISSSDKTAEKELSSGWSDRQARLP